MGFSFFLCFKQLSVGYIFLNLESNPEKSYPSIFTKTKWLSQDVTLMSPLTVAQLAGLSWSWDQMSSQRPLKTSAVSAPERRVSDSRDPPSTESSPTSCVKEETSPTTTELVENPSMETSSKTRTSIWSTPVQESSPWPTLAQTPTVHNFSCVPLRHPGWMENTSFSDPLLKEWRLWKRLNLMDLNPARPQPRFLLPNVVNYKTLFE